MNNFEITSEKVKKLREATGQGIMDCKKALVICEGDHDKAVKYLKEMGNLVNRWVLK